LKSILQPYITPVDSGIHRIVESQEKVATMQLVDSLEEQTLLEELIEQTKPGLINGKRHYLIETPFRYPPLNHGSRFGSRFEPSIFYGSHSIDTMLYETAYYSFYFMSAMTAPYENPIMNHKTAFEVNVKSHAYIDLSEIDESDWKEKLSSQNDYQFSQQVGAVLRDMDVKAFSYTSARDFQGKGKGKNMGVFGIDSLVGKPKGLTNWEIKQSQDNIVFYCQANTLLNKQISIEEFLVDGIIPSPSR
jgi:hypothetical protein